MKKLIFFVVWNFSLLVSQSLRINSTNVYVHKRNLMNCDDINMLKRKLSIFRINVRNWEIDLVSKGVSAMADASHKLFKFADRNVTSDQSQCNIISPQQMCAQKTVRRTFTNHFPSAMIEKQCTCDKCHSIGHPNSFLNNQEFACQPIFEREAVLVKENALHCIWTEYLRLKVVGCQCIIRRKIKQF